MKQNIKEKVKFVIIVGVLLLVTSSVFFNLSNVVNAHNEICEGRDWDGSVNKFVNMNKEYSVRCNQSDESKAITDVLNSLFFRE